MALGIVSIALGASTYLWDEAKISSFSKTEHATIQNGYGGVNVSGGKAYTGGDPTIWQQVSYNYEYKGESYSSWFIGFYLPFGIKLSDSGEEMESVYVLPLIPNISVLIRGIDFRLIFIFLAIAFSILYLRNWLAKMLNRGFSPADGPYNS